MATARPFAYNTGTGITGTTQVGNLAVGYPTAGFIATGLEWWMGADEDLGYVIAAPVPGDTQPTPITGVSGSVGFYRSVTKTDASFLSLSNVVAKLSGGGPFASASAAKTWLNTNGYWTSWISSVSASGLIANWDIQNPSSYSGTGTTITGLTGGINGTITGVVTYTAGSPNYLTVEGSASEYINSSASLNSSLSPATTGTAISVFVWVYPTSNGVILSEQGSTPPDSGWYDSQIEMVSGTMKFRVWALASPYISSSVSTPLNAWYYAGFTYSGTSLTAYVNGATAGSATISRDSPGNNGYQLYYNLGYPTSTNMGSGAGSTFRFGALHVYNTKLTAAEVIQNYNSTKSSYGL